MEDKMAMKRRIFIAVSLVLALSVCGCMPQQAALSGVLEAEAVLEPTEKVFIEPDPIVEPEPVVTLSADEIGQGEYLALRLENAENAFVTGFSEENHPFFAYDGALCALIGAEPETMPGEYVLTVTAEGKTFPVSVTVTEKTFDTQYLDVAYATLNDTLENKEAVAEFNEVLRPLFDTFTETPLWDDVFLHPLKVEYKVTTSYGTFRTFSNGSTEWHNAFDYAAKGGSGIYATASGRVIFAGLMKLTGNTVVIDHGCGVLSWYYHMEKLGTETGALISAGDKIGTVGTTGLSTGNHLHFGVSVGGKLVDPRLFFEKPPEFDF